MTPKTTASFNYDNPRRIECALEVYRPDCEGDKADPRVIFARGPTAAAAKQAALHALEDRTR